MAISPCNLAVDSHGRELAQHGTHAFPVACYRDDLCLCPVPWHWHEDLEAIIVCEGSILLRCADRQYTLHAGEGCLIGSGVLHCCESGGAEVSRMHSVVFHPRLVGGSPDSIFYRDYLQPYLDRKDMGCVLFSPSLPWQSQAIESIGRAWDLIDQTPPGHAFDVRYQLSKVICLLQPHITDTGKNPDAAALRKAQRMKQMLQFVHGHYAERITVCDIAHSAAISESECLRCFRSVIGLTPNQYLRQYRIQRAAELLLGSQEKVAVIAAACGFEDMSFFTKTFHQFTGQTPSAYRDGKAE